jgi:hypothetical protein
VISPLLANLYMNRFLKHWRLTEQGHKLKAHVIAYADDFVILSRGHAEEAKAWAGAVMTRLGLSLNEAKTSLRDAWKERFDFLGYSFGPHYSRKDGRRYLGASPSKKSVARLKPRISAILHRGNNAPWGRDLCQVEPRAERLVGLLRSRYLHAGLLRDRLSRRNACEALPGQASQGPLARDQTVLI